MRQVEGFVPPHIEHGIPFRRAGTYAPFPVLEQLPDGRLALGFPSNDGDYQDHGFLFDWNVLVSEDCGTTWTPSTDPAVPFSWPGTGPRERWDRFTYVLPNGTYLAAGAIGWTAWPAARRAEAEAAGLRIGPFPSGDPEQIVVAPSRLFCQRSADGGATWERREWEIPGGHRLTGFPRAAVLQDGTFLVPLYDIYPEEQRHRDRNLLLRSVDSGTTWTVVLMGCDSVVGWGDEVALVETAPGRVLALLRQNRPAFLLQSWSGDAGQTWSQPLRTEIWGYPPHLLRLRDGRILCTYGHRREPLGVQAVISADGGHTWGVAHRAILRADGETRRRGDRESRDLGYPVSVQLPDNTIFTAYYLTMAGVTHIATSRWELPW
ncbi:MAG: exo-alpha-sialidase [Chloroflexi bacterium]|nr:exo-alpha-sialidase [Chloroflexota bacterium]